MSALSEEDERHDSAVSSGVIQLPGASGSWVPLFPWRDVGTLSELFQDAKCSSISQSTLFPWDVLFKLPNHGHRDFENCTYISNKGRDYESLFCPKTVLGKCNVIFALGFLMSFHCHVSLGSTSSYLCFFWPEKK